MGLQLELHVQVEREALLSLKSWHNIFSVADFTKQGSTVAFQCQTAYVHFRCTT